MSYSKQFNVTLDVKQGKALSPLLFIHFINDVNDLRLLSIWLYCRHVHYSAII